MTSHRVSMPAAILRRLTFLAAAVLLCLQTGARQTATRPAPGGKARLTPAPGPSESAMIQLAVYAPGEPVLTDPQGNTTGYDPTTKTSYNSIPNAGYDRQAEAQNMDQGSATSKVGQLEVLHPVDGTYKLKITGAAEGKYDLYLSLADSKGDPAGQWNITRVPITQGTTHKFEIRYRKASGSAGTNANQLSGGFNGGGRQADEANQFLTYANPPESPMTVSASASTFPLLIFYSRAIVATTFSAQLNGADVTRWFHPRPGKVETVPLQLQSGENVLVLSIKGRLPSGQEATDTDRLVFLTQR